MSLLLFSACSSKDKLTDMFDSFATETAESVAYVCYNTLTINNETLNLEKVLKQNGIDGIFHEIYVIQNDTIWFGYSDTKDNGTKQWHIASTSMDGDILNIAYSGTFGLENEADKTYIQNSNSHQEDRYSTANGFYYNGKIILTDHVKMIEFDLSTASAKECSTKDYILPTLPIQIEITDYQTIKFCKDSEQKTFNIETAKSTSEAFEQLYNMESKKNWQGKSYLSELFNKVQVVNEQIFIICRVINWDGETHAIVFQYDFKNNSCQYAFHCFMDDVIGNDLYIVPKI